MRLTFVLGTAAELIKVYPIIELARRRGAQIDICATGQSRANFEMQYRDFDLPPGELRWLLDGSSDLEDSRGALRWFTRAVIAVFKKRGPSPGDVVIVHGDTLSTLVGALYGRRLERPVAHVEAGLRSTSLLNPFPEEITRRLVSRLARVHFAPDQAALANLKRSGARGLLVETRGNTLIDAVRMTATAATTAGERFALVNVHRFENLSSAERWRAIVDTLVSASQNIRLIVVLHPPTRNKLEQDSAAKARLLAAGIELRDRLPFAAFIALVRQADYLISDGGSNQEESSYLGKPCLLLRLSSERREGLGENCVLSRFEPAVIENFLKNPARFQRPPIQESNSPASVILNALVKT